MLEITVIIGINKGQVEGDWQIDYILSQIIIKS